MVWGWVVRSFPSSDEILSRYPIKIDTMRGLNFVSALVLYAYREGVIAKTTGSPIEVDLVFPNPNVTYSFDQNSPWTPLVFAVQGLRSPILNENLDFFFAYDTTNVNATNDTAITSANYYNKTFVDLVSNADGSPYFYIDTLPLNNPSPILAGIQLVDGIVNHFSINIYLNWGDASLASCAYPAAFSAACNTGCQLLTSSTFTVWPGSVKNAPEGISVAGPIDTMPGVANVCPEPIFYQGFNATATTMCDTYTQLPEASATPCAAKANAAAVSSISSSASALLVNFASAIQSELSSGGSAVPQTTGSASTARTAQVGTAASTTGSTSPTTGSSSTSRAYALVTAMPHPAAPLLLGAGLLGGLQIL